MTDPAPSAETIASRLRRVWAREMALHVVRGVSTVAGVAAVLILADLALDWSLDLPSSSRAILLAVNLVLLGYLAYARSLRYLRPYEELRAALRVEDRHPDLDTLLVSYVQFRDDQAAPAGVSKELMQAVRRQAAARVAGLDFRQVVSFKPVRRVLVAALVGVLALTAVGAVRPEFLGALGGRMLPPWPDTAYPTRTHIEVLTGDITVRQGEPVTLQAVASGETPDQGTLRVRLAGAGWETIALDGREGRFEHRFKAVQGNLDYSFRLGDARSETHRVTAARPPRIVEARVALKYPDYTKMAPEEFKTFNLKVAEGTMITWTLQTDRPVDGAEFVREGAGLAPVKAEVDGPRVRLSYAADASCAYRFSFRWHVADRNYAEPGVKHYIRVIPDTAPVVDILYPVEDEKATLKKTPAIQFWARDDYGLERAAVVYSINDAKEQKYPLRSLGGSRSVELTAVWPIKEAMPDLREGDIVTYSIEVTDGRALPGGALSGQSKTRRIQFVSEKAYAAYMLEQLQRNLSRARPPYLQEKDADDELKTLEQMTRPGAGAPTPAAGGARGVTAAGATPRLD